MEQWLIDFCKEQGLPYEEACPPWPGSYPPVYTGAGGGVRQVGGFYSSSAIAYPTPEGGLRVPEDLTVPYRQTRLRHGFRAAGKRYSSLAQLRHDRGNHVYLSRDIYGREVLSLKRGFPTFDEFDAMYEDRMYHWYFLREEGRLTRIYYCDEDDTVYVTEDVREIEDWCLETMMELGYFPRQEGWYDEDV